MQDAMLPPVAHAWVSPDGTIHDVDDEQLYEFCKSRQLHYKNMVDHKQNPQSDHKNGGWRLIDRRRRSVPRRACIRGRSSWRQ